MSSSTNNRPLRDLLDRCCDTTRPERLQLAWREFYVRYNELISLSVRNTCGRYNFNRMNLQTSEVVKDMALEVYQLLCANNYRNLQNYRNRDDETAFKAWLRRVSAHRTSYLVRKFFSRTSNDQEVEVLTQHIGTLDPDTCWELFEGVVDICRANSTRDHLERDLCIFLLWVFEGFSEDMIRVHPCLGNFGPEVPRNAKYHLRKLLRENADLLDYG